MRIALLGITGNMGARLLAELLHRGHEVTGITRNPGKVVAIIGLYFASQPELYARGIKRLVPVRHRERAGEIMSVIDDSLWRWLGGRFLLMISNGTLTAAGLWLLGVPLALSLGVIAGVLNFIPNIGPWTAAAPAVLIGFLQGPQQALYVALLYLLLQAIDGHLLTPLVDRKSVKLPPVLTITAMTLNAFRTDTDADSGKPNNNQKKS